MSESKLSVRVSAVSASKRKGKTHGTLPRLRKKKVALRVQTDNEPLSDEVKLGEVRDVPRGPLMKGFLNKKRKIGWHKRYFVLEKDLLQYFSSPNEIFPLGFISLREMKDVHLLPEKKNGRRFDIDIYNRVYSLCADSQKEAVAWVGAINRAIIATEAEDKRHMHREARTPRTPTFFKDLWLNELAARAMNEQTTTHSDFVLAFYKNALGRPELMRTLLDKFTTETEILRYLLQLLIGPPEDDIYWTQLSHSLSSSSTMDFLSLQNRSGASSRASATPGGVSPLGYLTPREPYSAKDGEPTSARGGGGGSGRGRLTLDVGHDSTLGVAYARNRRPSRSRPQSPSRLSMQPALNDGSAINEHRARRSSACLRFNRHSFEQQQLRFTRNTPIKLGEIEALKPVGPSSGQQAAHFGTPPPSPSPRPFPSPRPNRSPVVSSTSGGPNSASSSRGGSKHHSRSNSQIGGLVLPASGSRSAESSPRGPRMHRRANSSLSSASMSANSRAHSELRHQVKTFSILHNSTSGGYGGSSGGAKSSGGGGGSSSGSSHKLHTSSSSGQDMSVPSRHSTSSPDPNLLANMNPNRMIPRRSVVGRSGDVQVAQSPPPVVALHDSAMSPDTELETKLLKLKQERDAGNGNDDDDHAGDGDGNDDDDDIERADSPPEISVSIADSVQATHVTITRVTVDGQVCNDDDVNNDNEDDGPAAKRKRNLNIVQPTPLVAVTDHSMTPEFQLGAMWYLTPEGFASIAKDDQQRIYSWMQTNEFLELLCGLFHTTDFLAQRLALRVLWILLMRTSHSHLQARKLRDSEECPECRKAANQMAFFVQRVHKLGGGNLLHNYQVMNTLNGLLVVLMTQIHDFNEDAKDDASFSVMGKDVRNYGVWKALFFALAQSEFYSRRRFLKDINSIFIHRAFNCESLLAQSGWQRWVMPLMTDVPLNKKQRTVDKTLQYTVNLFTLLHYHTFANYNDDQFGFDRVMKTSLSIFERAKGPQRIACRRALLSSMLSKLRFHHNLFYQSFDGVVWRNLAHLIKFTKAYLFLTPLSDDEVNDSLAKTPSEAELAAGRRSASTATIPMPMTSESHQFSIANMDRALPSKDDKKNRKKNKKSTSGSSSSSSGKRSSLTASAHGKLAFSLDLSSAAAHNSSAMHLPHANGDDGDAIEYGLHPLEDLEDDLRLMERAMRLIKVLRVDEVKIEGEMGLDVDPKEAAALKQLQKDELPAFFMDGSVFLPIAVEMSDLDRDEVSKLVHDFVMAKNTKMRKKVFQAASERHKAVVKRRTKEAAARSAQIEKAMRESQERSSDVFNLLLLGAGESGKSTLFKQMQLIYGQGMSERDRKEYRSIVFDNIIASMRMLCRMSRKLSSRSVPEDAEAKADFADCAVAADDAKQAAEKLLALERPYTMSPDVAQWIATLWSDKGIRNTYAQRALFQLPAGDSVRHFFDDMERVAEEDYVPTEQDVLRSRMKTTGIVETEYLIDNLRFRMMDVGGQRNERKKWIHAFEDVTGIIFVAAISEYDQVIAEDLKTNRMRESLDLFRDVLNMSWFRSTSLIVFLNKRDLLQEKLPKVPLNKTFPDFCPPDYPDPHSYDDAVRYFKHRFTLLLKRSKRHVYIHVTCATDTHHIRAIFNDVKDIIIRNTLSESGLLV